MADATSSDALQLSPYIFFYGRCEEALEFYKKALGGSYDLQRVEGTPDADKLPAEARNRVMHATFTAPGISFMASDGQETKKIDPDAGNINLCLGTQDRARGERTFNALADGGTTLQPFGEAFWGGMFGAAVDRFGIEWMITTP